MGAKSKFLFGIDCRWRGAEYRTVISAGSEHEAKGRFARENPDVEVLGVDRGAAIATHKNKRTTADTGFAGEKIGQMRDRSAAEAGERRSDALSDVCSPIPSGDPINVAELDAESLPDRGRVDLADLRARAGGDQGGRGSRPAWHRPEFLTGDASDDFIHKGACLT